MDTEITMEREKQSKEIIEERIKILNTALRLLKKLKKDGLFENEIAKFLEITQTIALILKDKKIGSGDFKPPFSPNVSSSYQRMDFFANFDYLLRTFTEREEGSLFVNQCISAIHAGIQSYNEDLVNIQRSLTKETVTEQVLLNETEPENTANYLNKLEILLVSMIYNQIMLNPDLYKSESRHIPEQRKKAVKQRDKFHCQICNEKFKEEDLEVDYIYPYGLGGSNFPANLMALCKECNQNKGVRLEYIKSNEGREKILLNIQEFVRNLPITSNFAKWIEEMSKYRKKDGKVK